MTFTCQRCGACCRIKNGIVRVSEAEIARIAAFIGTSEADFIANETELAPDRCGLILKSCADGVCVYLTADNLCRINPVKPDKCRTFPFEWTNPVQIQQRSAQGYRGMDDASFPFWNMIKQTPVPKLVGILAKPLQIRNSLVVRISI